MPDKVIIIDNKVALMIPSSRVSFCLFYLLVFFRLSLPLLGSISARKKIVLAGKETCNEAKSEWKRQENKTSAGRVDTSTMLGYNFIINRRADLEELA